MTGSRASGRRLLRLAVVGALLAAALPASTAAAGPVTVMNGGGVGAWTPAGEPEASQFGLGVAIHQRGEVRAVRGHFNCIMAGQSAFPGFQMMAVRGQVTEAMTDSEHFARFSGVGTLYTNPEGGGPTQKQPAAFFVEVEEGGPGVGKLHLTVLPVGGSPVTFPPEWVASGHITIH